MLPFPAVIAIGGATAFLGGCLTVTPDPPSVSVQVGPAGATISHPRGALVTIPPGAIAAPISVTLSHPAPPAKVAIGGDPAGPAWVLDPQNLALALPATITLPYSPAGAESSLRIMTAMSGGWGLTALSTSRDGVRHQLTASCLHLGEFVPTFVFTPPEPIEITTPSTLPSARVGAPYPAIQIAAIGGEPSQDATVRPPYLFSSGSTLPDGLTLEEGGLLHGSPKASGTFGFTVHAVDVPGNVAEQAFSLIVN